MDECKPLPGGGGRSMGPPPPVEADNRRQTMEPTTMVRWCRLTLSNLRCKRQELSA